jgi:hypothetical protein
MAPFISLNIFPQDVLKAVFKYMKNPLASSCSDEDLMRILKKYDVKSDLILLEELPENTLFSIGRIAFLEKDLNNVSTINAFVLTTKKFI